MTWVHDQDGQYTVKPSRFEDVVTFKRGFVNQGPAPQFDIEAFGAVEGKDSAAAINRAITAALNEGGGDVFIPPTSSGYLVETPILIPISSQNLRLFGYGSRLEGRINSDLIQIGDLTTANNRAYRTTLQGLIVEGLGGTDTTYPSQNGIGIYASLGVYVLDCLVQNIPGVAIFGQKSAQTGSAFWNKICFENLMTRFIGKEGLKICTTGAVGDDLMLLNCLFNNLGWLYTTEPTASDGGVNLNVANLVALGCELSAIRNPDNSSSHGFTRALYLRKCAGLVAGIHFEDNCNARSGSFDLFADTDCNGLRISGIRHGCSSTTSAENGIKCTSKGNVIQGVCHDGGAHVMTTLVDVQGATAWEVSGLTDQGTPPTTFLAYTAGAGRDPTTTKILSGAGSPEGAITAAVGSVYLRTNGGAGTSIYIKETGSGNTGWAAK